MFLVFCSQLTVNFVALVTAFFAAIIGGTRPLNVLQLLWGECCAELPVPLAYSATLVTDSILVTLPFRI
jgi:Ca2+-transporting ATPase